MTQINKQKGNTLVGLLVVVAALFILPWNRIDWGRMSFGQDRVVTVVGEARSQEKNEVVSFSAGVSAVNDEKDKDRYIILATRNGLVKKTALKLYQNIRQTGIIAVTLNDNDELVWGRLTSGKDDLMLVTHQGKSIRFSEKEVKSSNRDTKGVKGITLRRDDYVIGVETIEVDEKGNSTSQGELLVITQNGLGKRTQLDQYPVQKRSGLGVKVAEINQKTGPVAAARMVDDEHKSVVITTKSGQTIKLPLSKKSIPTLTRPTQGVILMRLKSSDRVVAVALTFKKMEE